MTPALVSQKIRNLLGGELVANSFAELFRYRVRKSPHVVGFRFEEQSFTYSEMSVLVEQIRASLRRDSVAAGERVAAFMYNSPVLLALFFACALEGIVFSPVNVALRRNDLAYALGDLGTNTVVFDAELAEVFQAARQDCPIANAILYGTAPETLREVTPFDDWLMPYRGDGPEPTVKPNDPLCVIYSGGTTGLPKGIVMPQFGPVGAALRYNTIANFSTREVYFTTLQFSHSFAPLISLPFCLTYGHAFCFWKWWSASRYVDTIVSYGATISDAFIGMIATLLQQPPREADAQLKDVRIIAGLGGKDAVGMRLRKEFEARFGSKTSTSTASPNRTALSPSSAKPMRVRLGGILVAH